MVLMPRSHLSLQWENVAAVDRENNINYKGVKHSQVLGLKFVQVLKHVSDNIYNVGEG